MTVMTFNVANLFDTRNNPDKADDEFLPLEKKQSKSHREECWEKDLEKFRRQCLYWDWSREVVQEKMNRIARVIQQVDHGRGPDVLILQEIEHKDLLRTLNERHLKSSGYRKAILIESRDTRGIDIGMLSRFPLVGTPELHFVPFRGEEVSADKDTRGILEASFRWRETGAIITAFGVHFQSAANSWKYRRQGLQYLNRLRQQLPRNRAVIAGGDTNIPKIEKKKHGMVDELMSPDWIIPHRDHCAGCKGTSYYPPEDTWSFLDKLFLSKPDWTVHELRIPNEVPEQTTDRGRPKQFRLTGDPADNPAGVSDHWPVMSRISLKTSTEH